MYPAARIAHAQLPADPEARWKTVIPVVADLKVKAKKLGLWNLFLSKTHYPQWGVPLTNLEVRLSRSSPELPVPFDASRAPQYGVMAELLGRGGQLASESVNCSAPDTGNMGACWSLVSAVCALNNLTYV